MARKKIATLKKRDKNKPLAYVDKKGNVRHFRRGQKKKSHAVLQKNVVSAKLLKQRKAKGKKGILLFVKGKGVFQTARKLGRRKRKGRKAKLRRAGRKLRRSKARKGQRKSRRCPKTRKTRSLRAAKACVRAGKGRSKAKRRVFNLAVRRLRKSKSGRAFLKKAKIKMAKGVRRKA